MLQGYRQIVRFVVALDEGLYSEPSILAFNFMYLLRYSSY